MNFALRYFSRIVLLLTLNISSDKERERKRNINLGTEEEEELFFFNFRGKKCRHWKHNIKHLLRKGSRRKMKINSHPVHISLHTAPLRAHEGREEEKNFHIYIAANLSYKVGGSTYLLTFVVSLFC